MICFASFVQDVLRADLHEIASYVDGGEGLHPYMGAGLKYTGNSRHPHMLKMSRGDLPIFTFRYLKYLSRKGRALPFEWEGDEDLIEKIAKRVSEFRQSYHQLTLW
jgi:hypothetical protein